MMSLVITASSNHFLSYTKPKLGEEECRPKSKQKKKKEDDWTVGYDFKNAVDEDD